jgi:molybdopterin molybdotransferase
MSVRGEAIREGETAVGAGTTIRAEEIAVLAAVGLDRVTIHRKPRVAIIATGDEVVDVSGTPTPHQIRNSNSYALWAQAWGMGIPVHLLGIVPDEKEEIGARIREALEDDLILISGGVSMGEYDLVGEVLQEMGMEAYFDRVAVKPGKPTLFGTLRGKIIFGLPGNPVSGFVIFQLLVRPAIQKLMGVDDPAWNESDAVLEDGHLTPISRRHYLPGIVREGKVRPVPWKGSGDPFGPSRGNCLVQVPVGSPPLGPGDTVRVLHGQTPW